MMHCARIFACSAGLCAWLSGGGGGWARAADSAAVSPAWIDHPKSDDSVFLYRVGRSEGQPNRATAQQEAYRNALSVIVGEMLARSGVDESLRSELAANLPVQNAEIVPGAVHTETNRTGLVCWIQVSYPLAEKAKLLERIEPEKAKLLERVAFDRRLAALFAEARAAHGRGEHESARTNLQTVIRDYARLRAPAFELQDAQLLLGATYDAQKDFLAARQCYEEVAQNVSSAKWRDAAAARLKALPKAPRAWPLNDRWRGRKVALLCVAQDVGQPPHPFAALGEVLARDCREPRLESVDVTAQIKAAGIAALFEQRVVTAAAEVAQRQGAGVVLAVRIATDPSKRGQTQETMGIAMPVADSQVAFMVVDVAAASVCYGDRFSEVAGTMSESRLAERVAAMLVVKYLAPKCPTIAPPAR